MQPTNNLVVTASLQRELEQLVSEARGYAQSAQAANTRRAYESDWVDFETWCHKMTVRPCPASPDTVALYLTHLARTRKTSTLNRRLVAISHFHRLAGESPPTAAVEVQGVLAGIRRRNGTASKRKRPLLGPAVVKALELMPGDTMLAIRNRALLLIGYAGALRRGELAALDWEDCEVGEEGITLRIRKSKTDQTGRGTVIGIPRGKTPATCPVEALERWRKASEGSTGPVFQVLGRAQRIHGERLSSKAVARLVKDVAKGLGLDPSQFSAHSLRAGLATSAAQNGASERKIMDQTRHRSVKTVRIYIRDGELFRENAAKQSGL